MGIDLELRYFEDAFIAVLQAALPIEGIPDDQIAWPEKTFVPKKGNPFLKPEMAGRTRRPVGFGANSVKQWDGFYQIGVFVPRDTGTRLQNQVASQLLRIYPRGLGAQTPQGVQIHVTNSTAPTPVPWGDWINLPVQVEWFATEPP
jgi:Bacteriophage related domain of unknown function